MNIKFKKYLEFVNLDDPSDEQINELFGIFKNNQKIDKVKAAREKLKADTAKKVNDWRAQKAAQQQGDDDEDTDIPQAKNDQRRPNMTAQAAPKAAAAGRAAERDWVSNLAEEHRIKTVKGEEMIAMAKDKYPFGPGFSDEDLKDAVTMEIWGSSFDDHGEWTEFKLKDASGKLIKRKRVDGY